MSRNVLGLKVKVLVGQVKAYCGAYQLECVWIVLEQLSTKQADIVCSPGPMCSQRVEWLRAPHSDALAMQLGTQLEPYTLRG